jgi:prevent-host-death family protein
VRISVTAADGRLDELIRRAEAGEEIILTRDGGVVAYLTPVQTKVIVEPAARHALLEAVRQSGSAHAAPGPSAARSQDFLYDASGLPGES